MGLAELKARMLELLREDEEFRLAVAGLIGLDEVLKAIRALQEQVAENTGAIRALQEQVAGLQKQASENREAILALQEQVAENTKAIRALQEQVVSLQEQMVALQKQVMTLQEQVVALQKQVAHHSEVLTRHSISVERLARSIEALGARWGLLAEGAFREAMAKLVERYFGGSVRSWTYYDEDGFVFGHPSVIEVDMVIKDREHILVEIKSSVSRADVFELWRIGQLYERVRGIKPRLAIVSPFVREKAKKVAKELGIEVYTSLPF